MSTPQPRLRRDLALLALAALFLIPIVGCKKLLKGATDDDDDKDSGAATAANTPAADASPSTVDTTAAPTSTPADESFSPPGSCVDPQADILKRAAGSGAPQTVDKLDLDGDGKPDRVVHLDLGASAPNSIFAYVMRGSCGHFVGQFSASSLKLSGNKSKGLKSFEVFEKNSDCTDDCKCSDKSTALFFNGKAYQAAKPKDVPRKCTDGGAAPSGSASAGARGGACKLSTDCTAPFKCVSSPRSPKGVLTCEKACKQASECGDDERCIAANFTGAGTPDICLRIDCASIKAGSVMVDFRGEHDCAKPCKSDGECEPIGRPRQCMPGATQLKPRRPVSVCFPL